MKHFALKVLIVSVAISAVLGVWALLVGNFGRFEVKILMTSISISITSILAMACGIAWEQRRLMWIPQAGVGLAVLACALTLFALWVEPEDEFTIWKVTGSVAVVAVAAAHASLMALAGLARRLAWSRAVAYVFAFALSIVLIVLMWQPTEDEFTWRIVGVLSVLLSAATIAVPVFHRMSRAESSTLFCPVCTAPLDAEQTCTKCGERFRIERVERDA